MKVRMRLFAGLDLPPEVVRNLEQLLEQLRPTARIQWSPPANLHITTKFIGEWPEERLAELKAALGGAAAAPGDSGAHPRASVSSRIRTRRASSGAASRRRVWRRWRPTPTAPPPALGIDSEKRAFSPHLTLARIKERVDLQPLREKIAALPSLEFGAFDGRPFLPLPQQTRAEGFRVH